jgi:putative endopeptidase
VDPCQNFYEHACGGWIARAEIPSYMSSYDRSFTAAQVETRRRLRELYTADYPAGSPFNDLHSFYSACMNTTAIDALGAEPARALLRRIDAIETEADLADALAAMWAVGFSPFFKLDGAVGLENRTEKVLAMKANGFRIAEPETNQSF